MTKRGPFVLTIGAYSTGSFLTKKGWVMIVILHLMGVAVFGQANRGPGGVGNTDGSGNLSLWLDASAITGLANGGDVNTWLDLSGNGNHAVVTSSIGGANTAPNYVSNGSNNMPALSFNGANNGDGMEVAGNAEILPTNEISVFWAGNYEDGVNWAGVLFAADDDNWDDGWGFARNNGNNFAWAWVENYNNPGIQMNLADFGTSHIWNWIFNTTDNLVYGYKSENALTPVAFAGPITYDVGGNDNLLIGRSFDGGEHFRGQMNEVIQFNVALNDAQRIIVSNYLSAKYAITLSSNNTYREDDDGFDYHVAGIGQASDGSSHTDAQGSGIVRVYGATDLGNNEFFMWGFDNGALEATETTDVPSGVAARLVGQWGVSEADASGNTAGVDVGTIDMVFDLSGLGSIVTSDLRLLIDTDGDGSYTDETAISGATNVSGSLYQFPSTSALGDGDRFTIGTVNRGSTPLMDLAANNISGPAGVGGTDGTTTLALWLNAGTLSGANGTAVTSWSDLSGYGNNASDDGAPPELQNNVVNGQPVVRFAAGSLERIRVFDDASLNPQRLTAFTVMSHTAASGRYGGILVKSTTGNWDDGYGFYREDNGTDIRGFISGWDRNFVVTDPGAYSTPAIVSMVYDQTNVEVFLNETSSGLDGYTTAIADETNEIWLGWNNWDNDYMDGDIAEAIIFGEDLNDAQRILIHNYLSAKYNIALTANNVYNEDESNPNGNYDHEVAGIGQAADGSNHTDAQGSGILRIFNPTGLNNSEFLMWGHDNGALSATETTDIPSGLSSRLERVWAVSENSGSGSVDVGSIDMLWDLSSVGADDPILLRLLVDTDNDGSFTDETPISGSLLTGANTFWFPGIDALADNTRFTIGFVDALVQYAADGKVMRHGKFFQRGERKPAVFGN